MGIAIWVLVSIVGTLFLIIAKLALEIGRLRGRIDELEKLTATLSQPKEGESYTQDMWGNRVPRG